MRRECPYGLGKEPVNVVRSDGIVGGWMFRLIS